MGEDEKDLFDEIFGEEIPESPPESTKKSLAEIYGLSKIPRDFLDEAVRIGKVREGTKTYEILKAIYDDDAEKLKEFNNSTIKTAVRRYKKAWDEYRDIYTSEAKSVEVLPHPEAKTSLKTTTYQEIDKVVSAYLAQIFRDKGTVDQILKRIGQITLYTLLTVSGAPKDEAVRLAEMVTKDPNELYNFVVDSLEAMVRMSDPYSLKRFFLELTWLRRKVQLLSAEVEVLTDMLAKEREEKFLMMMMLNERQKDALLAMQALMRAYEGGGLVGAGSGAFGGSPAGGNAGAGDGGKAKRSRAGSD